MKTTNLITDDILFIGGALLLLITGLLIIFLFQLFKNKKIIDISENIEKNLFNVSKLIEICTS